jgi:hypothetical protein
MVYIFMCSIVWVLVALAIAVVFSALLERIRRRYEPASPTRLTFPEKPAFRASNPAFQAKTDQELTVCVPSVHGTSYPPDE